MVQLLTHDGRSVGLCGTVAIRSPDGRSIGLCVTVAVCSPGGRPVDLCGTVATCSPDGHKTTQPGTNYTPISVGRRMHVALRQYVRLVFSLLRNYTDWNQEYSDMCLWHSGSMFA